MNKKNIPIFISVIITSLFFTYIIYMSYNSLQEYYDYIRTANYADAYIRGDIDKDDVDKLEELDEIEMVGSSAEKLKSAMIGKDILALDYHNNCYFKMIGDSYLREGEYPKDESEIVISSSMKENNSLDIGDEIELEIGDRVIDNSIIAPMATYTEDELFKINNTESYKIVGIIENKYNKMTKVSNASLIISEDMDVEYFIRFKNFKKAYLNKNNLEKEIKELTGKTIELEFSEGLIKFYNLDKEGILRYYDTIFALFIIIICILVFVFLIRNVYKVWGLKKIKELSMYKSIGSTDFQIFKILLKEACFVSFIPVLLGHILGYFLINFTYEKVLIYKQVDPELIRGIVINPKLSAITLIISLLVVMISILYPARQIAKINIIDGLRGDINLKNIKRKRDKNIWNELKINNLASIKSQRYVSALGMFIMALFLLALAITNYNNKASFIETDDDIKINFHSNNLTVPSVFNKIKKELPNERTIISSNVYISYKNEFQYSDQFIDKELEEKFDNYIKEDEDKFRGNIIALDDETFEKIGEKGKIYLCNIVQDDIRDIFSEANFIPYFKDIEEIAYDNGTNKKIRYLNIDGFIDDLGDYKIRLFPYEIILVTDFDTYHNIINDWKIDYANKNRTINYEFAIQINDKENINDYKEYILQELEDYVSYDESFEVFTGEEINNKRKADINSTRFIILITGILIGILNITNSYSSINLSLMNRKREIASLLSAGMEMNSLVKLYSKDFVLEQIKSLSLVLIGLFSFSYLISIFSESIDLIVIARFYPYLGFFLSAISIYGFNILLYRSTLKNYMKIPIIDLIK